MKIRTQLMVMFVMACSVSVLAQTGMSSDSSMNKSMSKKMTMTGCVSEKGGKYMLTDKKHPDGLELMSSQDLKVHVGHKISVTGMMESAMAGDSMAKDSMAKDSMATSGFRVTSMKMVSDHCAMPDAMMKK
jgi:hypothetical protein